MEWSRLKREGAKTAAFAGLPDQETLYRPATANHVDQDHDNRHYQQDVNEPADRVRRYQSKQPQDQKNYRYRPEHLTSLLGPFYSGR